MRHYKNLALFVLMTVILAGCNMLGEDNLPTPSPLPEFQPNAQLVSVWSASVGTSDEQHLRFQLGIDRDTIFAAGERGSVVAVNRQTGEVTWQRRLDDSLTAGVGVGDGIVVVGSNKGQIIALSEQDGKTLWQQQIANQALAVPVIIDGTVYIKTIDDDVIALTAKDGQQRWNYAANAPQLVLRLGSMPAVTQQHIIVGLANGRILSLSKSGNPVWQNAIAIPKGAADIDRMVDIDATPIVQGEMIYAASYQGNIAALHLGSGDIAWQKQLSTYSDLAVDSQSVYTVDAEGYIRAFVRSNGKLKWEQSKLAYRWLTAPQLMQHYLVVGDGQGYLHLLSKQTGKFVARVQVDDSAIVATPIVQGDTIYVLSSTGDLRAYQVNATVPIVKH